MIRDLATLAWSLYIYLVLGAVVVPVLLLITGVGALMEWLMPSRRHAFALDDRPCPPRSARPAPPCFQCGRTP